MAIQVIVYSIATGRVRGVDDPTVGPGAYNPPNAIAYLNQVPIRSGEARLLYNKQGNGSDTTQAWQAAVNAHTGFALNYPPDATATDWYCGVDSNNLIRWWGTFDPASMPAVPGLTMVNAPWPADGTYTYTPPSTFTAPILATKT